MPVGLDAPPRDVYYEPWTLANGFAVGAGYRQY
jgi:hypothetical protein